MGAAHTRVVPNSQILGLKRPIFFFLLSTMLIGLWFTPQAPHGPALAASPQKPNAMRSIYIHEESQPQRMLAQTPGPLCPERSKPLSPGAGWRAWNRIFATQTLLHVQTRNTTHGIMRSSSVLLKDLPTPHP